MDRLTIVSCDCHAAAPPEVYREYLEAGLRARYDAMIASPEAVARRAAQVIGPFAPSGDGEGEREPLTARWDPMRRLAELDRDGIAAEVLFPQTAGRNAPPFYNVFGHPFDPNDPAAAAAGCRAHNRWLADFVKRSPAPERHGVPPAELRAMLGENAMAIYGFDPRTLAAIAARIGPTLASFA